jgi:GT2 family glycosyltransferase
VRDAARKIAASGLFDREFYLAKNKELGLGGGDPLKHYLSRGVHEGRDPHPLFSTSYYLQKYPDVAASGINPLLHYITLGAAEGRMPNRLFDSAYYLRVNPTVAEAGMNPLAHYCAFGWKENRQPHPLFDGAFYRQEYTDVEQYALNPLSHYLHYGAAERRYPSPWFDVSFYLQRNPDVAESGMDPLEHYILHGAAERRGPHPLFDSWFHLRRFADEPAAIANPLRHFVEFAAAQGAWPNRLFDPEYYLRNCTDPAARANPVLHYSRAGWKKNQNPHPLFDGAFYRERYPDVEKTGAIPLVHYLHFGAAERRSTNAWFDARWYVEKYPDTAGQADVMEHYVLRGASEGRAAGPTFETRYYVENHPEVVPAGVNPLVDWMLKVESGKAKPRFWNRPAPLRRDLRPRRVDAKEAVERLKHKPLISVLVPTFNTEVRHLRSAIESVKAQTYPSWELCICDDGSSDESTLEELGKIEKLGDDRIHVRHRGENGGISRATNDALAMARGEFVAMLDHDDELFPDALLEIIEAIDGQRDMDVIYTDQAYLSADGEEEEPIRKPDWSPRLLWGVMYVGHLLVVRRELAKEVGGFDPRFDNVQDFELMLRVGERTDRIVHVPKILYYWRRAAGSVARHGDSKRAIPMLQSMAVNAHLERMKVEAVGLPHPVHAHRLSIVPKGKAKVADVSVFVRPTGDGAALARCLESVLAMKSAAVFVAGNGSGVAGRLNDRVRIVEVDPFFGNVAGTENFVGDIWISMTGDGEVIGADWLEQMTLAASLPGVAYACPLVLQQDGEHIDEAGLIVGLGGLVGSAMRGWRIESDGHAGSLSCLREVSAISDVCVAARQEVALARAADEKAYLTPRFRMAQRAMSLGKAGKASVCNPRAVVRRIGESVPLGAPSFDSMLFADLWSEPIKRGDPYHNVNFNRTGSGFI